jgi:coenzyme F420-0:L-glutamate ligase/coenzyme F420-1:gamma-L-glutamate ligase
MVQPGDNLSELILIGLNRKAIRLESGDILVLAQKIISKAEGRLVNLAQVVPSERALKLAAEAEKDPRLMELVLRESRDVLRVRPGSVIVEHRLGFVCANAGIDHSNVAGEGTEQEEWVLLLPADPDASACRLRGQLEALSGCRLGVMIIDSHGRAWRLGVVGIVIGLSGLPALVDLRGQPDLTGYTLRHTTIGAADELAAGASLVMGQAAEGTPVVHVRGFPYALRDGSLKELLRPREQDLFR